MQMRNSERLDPVGSNSFWEAIDFPTEEELLAALEASLEQSPWLPRATTVAVPSASSDLARPWSAVRPPTDCAANPDEYHSGWPPDEELPVEPDFLAGLAKFLTDRLALRMREIDQVQQQLHDELARLKG